MRLKHTTILAAICPVVLVASCTDYDYDLKNIDTSGTILPNLTVPLPESSATCNTFSVDSLFGTSYHQNQETGIIEIAEGFSQMTGDSIIIRYALPESLTITDADLRYCSFPLSLKATNPTGKPVKMTGTLSVNGKSRNISWDLSSDNYEQTHTEDISDLTNDVPQLIAITDIVFQDANVIFDKKYDFKCSASTKIPLSFKPETKFSCSYVVNTDSLGFELPEIPEIGVDHAALNAEVDNGIPFSFNGSICNMDGETIAVINRVEAGRSGQTLVIDLFKDAYRTNEKQFILYATVINDTDKNATIDASISFSYKLKSVSTPDGIEI